MTLTDGERTASKAGAVEASALSPSHEPELVKGLAILFAALVAVVVCLLPSPAGLSPEGQRVGALFLVALTLWATEALPIAITTLALLVLQPILGVAKTPAALSSFFSPVFFFVVAMFCVAAALTQSGLATRFAHWLLAKAGTDARRLLLAFVLGTGLLSMIMGDVPVCTIFMAMATGMFARAGLAPGSSRFAKAVMIGIPIASLTGGVGTPAGSSVNILGLYFIEQYGHVRVPFLSWVVIGVPMVLILLPLLWWILVRVYPPERDTIEAMAVVRDDVQAPLSVAEKKAIAILGTMLALWTLSTWVPALDITLIGLAGAVAMFLPGARLLTWNHAERLIGWDALFMIGGVTSLGAASVDTGFASWMVEGALGGMQGWSTLWVVATISAFTVVVHLVLPVAPVVNAVLIPPVVLMAAAAGHNPALYALPVAFTASCGYLLPLEAVSLITYSKGYYRMLDMLVPGTVVSIAWVILMTALMLLLAPPLGLL